MAEEIVNTNNTANEPGTQPVNQGVTQPQVVNVDEDAIIAKAQTKAEEAAGKKMESVFKSMLEQQGLDAETINKMTEDWKSKQVTPEDLLKQKDDSLIQKDATIKELTRQVEVIGKGIDKDKAPKYIKLAESYMDDNTNFEAALDLALKDFPLPTTGAPNFAAGTGTAQLNTKENVFAERINKYKPKGVL